MSEKDAVARLVEKLRREYADVQLLPGVNYGDADVLKACDMIEAGAALAAATSALFSYNPDPSIEGLTNALAGFDPLRREIALVLNRWDRAVAALGEE